MTSEIDAVSGGYVLLDGERYYRISNSHLMPDFFMSLVGASDHWMFVSSNGALTAGRRNPDLALFPYASDDQISAARDDTGPTTLIRAKAASETTELCQIWEPFAGHSAVAGNNVRNLYKTPLGNKLAFEETNESLQLVFRYRWTFSERFGFVRSCHLENTGDEACSLELLDGLRNVLPHGVGSDFQMRFSNLANAYKKNELVPESDIGLFYLSSVPTDRAEPSEGLRSTTVWQTGLTPDAILLSADQLPSFRAGERLRTETDVRGQAGAFLINQSLDLEPGDAIQWHVVAELAQDHADIIRLDDLLQAGGDLEEEIATDICNGEQEFLRIVSSADGLQCSANANRANRHLANTLFNVMRGGVPLEDYRLHTEDFVQSIANFNRPAFERHESYWTELPDAQEIETLRQNLIKLDDPDLTRLGLEYLPFAFSRRHGDPTRPWNRFSIDLKSDDGSTNLNYQGNWRDIFQNWEALILSFPDFSTAMICRFVNATTADGYNPYRLTKGGFEWEEPVPDDPWANIGYWGDHQIIYLLKLLEWSQRFHPEGLTGLLDSPVFVHANVPYRIKDYAAINEDPRDTIEFDAELSSAIARRVEQIGADGKLLQDANDEIHRVTLVEKILTLSLAKLSNFVPDGGIWLNTQRPEWNDANNALVGNGLSMVTACYLHRWFKFLHDWLESNESDSFHVSQEVAVFFERIASVLREETPSSTIDAATRLLIVDGLSQAGSDYRNGLYSGGMSGQVTSVSRQDLLQLFGTARHHLQVTIENNRRSDGLYHSYNLLDRKPDGIEIEHLSEMLEGQVAVLSSGLLPAAEVVQLLDSLRNSRLYRENQGSYLLYPDRQLPRFLDKNNVPAESADSVPLLKALLDADDQRVVIRDRRGGVHFNGQFRNSSELRAELETLGPEYEALVNECESQVVQLFDDVFGHRQFTGRSGTFFAYEGLGSIYWHMVSKLALAVSENCRWAIEEGVSQDVIDSLQHHLAEIRRGIGAEKSPAEYGAFPTDPYSHTPENAGVKQPGMTGQVKEDVLARFDEIGVQIDNGCLWFDLSLFDHSELVNSPSTLEFYDLVGEYRSVVVPEGGFGFTLFQVPIIYQASDEDTIEIHLTNGEPRTISGNRLDQETSRELFSRSGNIEKIECKFKSIRR